MSDNIPSKKQKICEGNCFLQEFGKWLVKEEFEMSKKFTICTSTSSSRFGAAAVEDITNGEILFSIPRKSILWEKNCPISTSLKNYTFDDASGWVKLLLCLMFEYTNKSSNWLPYIKFFPDIACIDQPMFWSIEERSNLLKGTGVFEAVEKDLKKIQKEYYEVALPFMKKHSNLGFNPNIHTLNLYKHMVAVIMAYSFTNPSNDGDPPMMVPLADVLNHSSHNNAALEYGDKCLMMKATTDIKCGEEIYNTYGHLSNSQLLQMYGFVESVPFNLHDTVEIELSLLLTCAENEFNSPCLDKKCNWLAEKYQLFGSFPITLCHNGILTLSEFKLISKILFMSEKEFHEYLLEENESDGWESDDADDEENECEYEVISFKKLRLYEKKIQLCLGIAAQTCLNRFNKKYLEPSNDDNKVIKWRKERSSSLIYSQCQLLRFLTDLPSK